MADRKFGDELIAKLKRAAADLEEFQVQLALGKADARDKYEELKKKFNRALHNAKAAFGSGKQKAVDIVADIEDLQVQLALGKAETKDTFNEQRKKIVRAVNRLENTLRAKVSSATAEAQEKLHHEIEKFRIKLEILRLQFELGRMDVREQFEERKHDLGEKLAKLKSRLNGRASSAQHRRDELKEAYKHLKKAFAA